MQLFLVKLIEASNLRYTKGRQKINLFLIIAYRTKFD
jgi:hypothetical protein